MSFDIHSISIDAQTRIQGDKTENKDKDKSPVVTITGFRDLKAEFEEYNNNSSNGVNAASSSVSTARQNSEHDDDIQKSVSLDIHSISIDAQTRIQGDKTENKDKDKSPVVTITGFRDLNAEFEEYNNNSSNGVDAASSSVSTARQNSIDSTNDFSKSVSPDIYSSSSGAQIRKQGDKTENKDKGKSLFVTITGFKDLNVEFEECTNNSSNGVNAASSSVFTAGHNFINSTNEFSAAGPSNTFTSPTVANSSSQDASTSSHDSDMPNLEDLTHSDDADDVGADADINNMESII
nr:hypothetical protein [Tanacetum cinerariifolium]